MNHVKSISRFGLSALSASLAAALLGAWLGSASTTQAAVADEGNGPQLLIGRDDDRQNNVAIQAGAVANQSLNRTDVIVGGSGNDVIFGLNGNDVIDGGPGRDIILGGPDGGPAPGGPPNSDIMFGGTGNDVNLWAPGDGSEAFIGGQGRDALIFGATDREELPIHDGSPAAHAAVRGSRVSSGHSDGERQWSHKLLHAGEQPLT